MIVVTRGVSSKYVFYVGSRQTLTGLYMVDRA